MLTNYPKLTDAEIGSTLSRPLLLSAIEENTDKNGNAYVKVTLKDGFSDVTAVMFSTSAADLEARLITVKIWEYSTSEAGDAAFTSSGVLFGHLYMGASLIKGFSHVKDTAPYHSEKVQLLIHLILAHHGTQEWGTVACPAIPEALVLHYIDNLDAKMYMFEEQYESMDAGELSDKKPFGLDNRVYKAKY